MDNRQGIVAIIGRLEVEPSVGNSSLILDHHIPYLERRRPEVSFEPFMVQQWQQMSNNSARVSLPHLRSHLPVPGPGFNFSNDSASERTICANNALPSQQFYLAHTRCHDSFSRLAFSAADGDREGSKTQDVNTYTRRCQLPMDQALSSISVPNR